MLHVSDTSLKRQWFSSFGVVTKCLMCSAKEPGFKWSPIILHVLDQLRSGHWFSELHTMHQI